MTSSRRDAFVDSAWSKNRTLCVGYALVFGQPEHHPEGSYSLRYLRDGNAYLAAVGPDEDARSRRMAMEV